MLEQPPEPRPLTDVERAILSAVKDRNAAGYMPNQAQAVQAEMFSSRGAAYRRRQCQRLEREGLIKHQLGSFGRSAKRYTITLDGMLALGYPTEQARARLHHYGIKIKHVYLQMEHAR